MLGKGGAMMRTYVWVLVFAAIALLWHERSCLAADQNERAGMGITNGVFYQKTCPEVPINNTGTAPTGILLSADSDRGCCVLKTSKAKCVYTNRAYCKRKAKQANIPFEFNMGTDCQSIPACR
jgi:hypothetical protein